MRAYFYRISSQARAAHLAIRWKALGGDVVTELDSGVRYVFTDSPRPWAEEYWNRVWSTTRLPERSFYMVPAQWITTLRDPITPITIPPYSMKRTYDKIVQLFSSDNKKETNKQSELKQPEVKSLATSVSSSSDNNNEKQNEIGSAARALLATIHKTCVQCQYGSCQQLITKTDYDAHLLQHMKDDKIVEPPHWKDMMFLNSVRKPLPVS